MKAKVDKNEIKKLYLAGFNANEIAKKLKCKVENIRKYIQRNFKELKAQHEKSVIERREVLKAVNYEANKYISDSSFIKKNRSIYKTNSNGDIVLNKKVAPVVTWDTPRRLVNENKTRC